MGTRDSGTATPSSADLRTLRSATGSAPLAPIRRTSMSAPMPRSMSSRPERVGFMPTLRINSPSPPAPSRPATMKNAADEKSPGTFSR